MQRTLDPRIYTQQLNPPRRKIERFVFDDAAKAKLQASVDQTVPLKEDTMGSPAMQVGDVGGDVKPTGIVRTLREPMKPPPFALSTVAPSQDGKSVAKPAVQRFNNPAAPAPDTTGDLLKELEAEDAPAQAKPAENAGQGSTDHAASTDGDVDVDAILKRFKGSPEDIAKQLAKSYASIEKRARQKEAELDLLKKQPAPTAPTAPVQTPEPVQPNRQIVVNPFDYKKAGDTLLDDPAGRLKEFDEHLTAKVQHMLADMAMPLYTEQMETKLKLKFPDVVTDDNLDVIKAIAATCEGSTHWAKLTAAVQKYQTAIPSARPTPDPTVEQMKVAAHSPTPMAKSSGGKVYRGSDIRKLMQSPDYQKDPAHRKRVDRLHAEGRIKWDE